MGTVSQKPSNAKGWGQYFITVPPPPTLPPLPLRHFIFLLSHHTSRFTPTHVASASSHPDLSDGTEEESCEPEESEPKEGSSGSQSRQRVGVVVHGETELERLVAAGVLPDRVTTGWRPASGEPFLMPNTDEVVVFEKLFLAWVGVLCSSFPEGSIGALGG